jgi:hypothetical protein
MITPLPVTVRPAKGNLTGSGNSRNGEVRGYRLSGGSTLIGPDHRVKRLIRSGHHQ